MTETQNTNALFDCANRTALVTGASSGLGKRAALVLAAAGASVVGVARRADALAAWQEECVGKTASIVADVSNREALPDLAARVSEPFGPPQILVHAAGINTREPADAVTAEGWDKTLELNLSAPFFLSQALVPNMAGWGRIVLFASLQSTRAFPGGIAYGASKGGITQLARAMSEAWGPRGITANAIGPGFFPTELTQSVFADPDRAARNAAQTCLGRNGAADDIDGPLLFLCSEASAYVTGQTLMVDGGYTAK
ncbi:SDR family NAD(P)-dependent oxidoreductase [Cognatishimia sp. F0-27]|uniref:SDR family NAD(P)-dependent oxidoreductase n=1 Tax=Cognatishimia sp. F0-27 TaxID=2816855 RepID=UPI001D0C0B20|nr:SDR family oxidoreductase [Cognatishimia sp. F0-27]MCC1495144.1 SDR family oxidoreductase [Cognatishimia sp. F0-27]